MKYKYLFIAVYFLVTWKQYELKPHYDGVTYASIEEEGGSTISIHKKGHIKFYTVETITKTITLKTQEDVKKFTGVEETSQGDHLIDLAPLIGNGAFNIRVEKLDEW